ncbi:hypothetical protein F4801DRAFT_194280 [Xylaria longipes]|nr:hypothetical protein F4801DRAFT_194280 [Xylaria longipes]
MNSKNHTSRANQQPQHVDDVRARSSSREEQSTSAADRPMLLNLETRGATYPHYTRTRDASMPRVSTPPFDQSVLHHRIQPLKRMICLPGTHLVRFQLERGSQSIFPYPFHRKKQLPNLSEERSLRPGIEGRDSFLQAPHPLSLQIPISTMSMSHAQGLRNLASRVRIELPIGESLPVQVCRIRYRQHMHILSQGDTNEVHELPDLGNLSS